MLKRCCLMTALISQALKGAGNLVKLTVQYRPEEYNRYEAKLHESFGDVGGRALRGKTWDLRSAYRQLARHPADAPFTIVGVWCPRAGRVEFYEQVVLAFGAASSFSNFCLVARALWTLMTALLGVCCGQYVDDFPVVEVAPLAGHLQKVLDRFFALLGWPTKQEGEFDGVFAALGVEFDLRPAVSGRVLVKNTAKRVREIVARIAAVLAGRELTRAEARNLRGRLHHACGQTFGRCGAASFRLLGLVADGSSLGTGMMDEVFGALSWFSLYLSNARPRTIRARTLEHATLFVDGCCEPGADEPFVGIGAVLFSPRCSGPRFFGARLGKTLLQRWSAGSKDQLVAQAELLPVAVAKATWQELLVDTGLLVFIDNYGARYGLIAGYSGVQASGELIGLSYLLDSELGICSWFSRVPSAANLADGPSRLNFGRVARWPGASRDEPVGPSCGERALGRAIAAGLRGS